MESNERGSTLVLVLIVILVFSVLGVSLIGNSVSERKRVDVTEADGQARVLAQSGLGYFESQFKTYAKPERVFTMNELKEYFKSYNVSDGNLPDNVDLSMNWDDLNNIVVTSKGTEGSIEKTITGHYRLGFDIDKPTSDIAEFTIADTKNINFANKNIVDLGLLKILDLGLLNLGGGNREIDVGFEDSDRNFYVVPNDTFLEVGLGLGLLDVIELEQGNFDIYKDKKVIAVRKGSVLEVELLKLLDNPDSNPVASISLLDYPVDENLNVLINGYTETFDLLGGTPFLLKGIVKLILETLNLEGLLQLLDLLRVDDLLGLLDKATKGEDYKDIEFKKFAVFGNAIIQQDKGTFFEDNDDDPVRRFTFDDGLYVGKSLAIGAKQNSNSSLMLRGDMVARENLIVSYANITIGDNEQNEKKLSTNDKVSNFYAHGDVLIKKANIQMKNDKYDFGILTKGKMTIEECGSLNGLFYSEKGIDIKTNGKKIVINGGLIGNITVDGVPFNESTRQELGNGRYKLGNLEYNAKPEYLDKFKNVTLTLKESK